LASRLAALQQHRARLEAAAVKKLLRSGGKDDRFKHHPPAQSDHKQRRHTN